MEVIVNNIKYELNLGDKTAEVGFQGSEAPNDIVIETHITHNGVEYTVNAIGRSAFYSKKEMNSVVIPNGITLIDANAFEFSNITNFFVGNTITSIKRDAFSYCHIETLTCEKGIDTKKINNMIVSSKNLQSIILDETDLFKNKDISKYVFNYVANNLDLYNIEVIKDGFKKKKTFILPLLKTLNPKILVMLFDNKISSYDAAKEVFEEMEMDSECKTLFVNYLSTATIEDKKEIKEKETRKEDIEIGIESCKLKDIKEEWKCSKKDNKILFKGYLGAKKSVTIPGSIDGISDYVFQFQLANKELKEIRFANGVKSIDFENGKAEGETVSTFYRSRSVDTIIFPDSLEDINFDFSVGSTFKILGEINGVVEEPTYLGKVLFSIGDTSVKTFEIKEGTKTIHIIDSKKYEQLEEITIPESVTRIGTYSFYECKSLKDCKLPSGLTNLGNSVFYNCNSLQNIIIPNGVTTINESTFSCCGSLVKVILPKGLKEIRNRAFDECKLLEEAELPNGLETICDDAFHACHALKEIKIPNTIKTIGEYAFSYCLSASAIIFEDNTQLNTIDKKSFMRCDAVTDLRIPNGVQIIDNYAFCSCKSLKTLTISKSVKTIGFESFSSCEMLETLTVESSDTVIGKTSFKNCPLLK